MTNYFLTPKQVQDNWSTIVFIYFDDRNHSSSPEITANRIVSEIGLQESLETFSVVCALKKHDGRIYGNNRNTMNQISFDPNCMNYRFQQMDDIHSTHINQILTYLIKELNKNKEV